MTQFEETKREVIEYFKTNNDNGTGTIARKFNLTYSTASEIISEYLSSLSNSMQ